MRDINLLPESYRYQTSDKHHVYLVVAIAGILVLSLIYFTYSFYRLNTIKNLNEASLTTLNKLNETNAPNTKAEKRAALVREFVKENRQTSQIIKTVFVKVPLDLSIVRITGLENGQIVISGTGKSNQQITQYTEDLMRSSFFKTLTIKSSRESGPHKFEFELQGSY